MASRFGARMRVGPKTMARFSAFIRLNFSFCVTLQIGVRVRSEVHSGSESISETAMNIFVESACVRERDT